MKKTRDEINTRVDAMTHEELVNEVVTVLTDVDEEALRIGHTLQGLTNISAMSVLAMIRIAWDMGISLKKRPDDIKTIIMELLDIYVDAATNLGDLLPVVEAKNPGHH